MKRLTLLAALYLCSLVTIAQEGRMTSLNDGPYIFIEEDHLLELNVINGAVVRKSLSLDTYPITYRLEHNTYDNIKKVVVLSDIHGQYDLAIEILKNNRIINDDLNWRYGKGHLVIVGDIFDRGPKVNEMLWLIYNLEQEAKKEGGRVHFLLGNHEYMILQNNLKYLHKKYVQSSALLEIGYDELYGPKTILGRWLRSKPTIIKINDNTFVHGGISKQFLTDGYDMNNTNEVLSASIDRDIAEMKSTGFRDKYYGSKGPIWYRGYFRNNLPDSEIIEILEAVDSKHIIVGHCSNDEVVQLYDHKIFGVDSSIKKGKYGEVLFILRGKKYYRGTMQGRKIRFRR